MVGSGTAVRHVAEQLWGFLRLFSDLRNKNKNKNKNCISLYNFCSRVFCSDKQRVIQKEGNTFRLLIAKLRVIRK